jgi:hypothetical protein
LSILILLDKEKKVIVPNMYSIEVTPQLAKKWLTECHYEHQRPLKRTTIMHYAKEMLKGDFIPFTHLDFVINGKSKQLIDGQHRLSAVIESGISNWFCVTEVIVKDQDEAGKRYGATDLPTLRGFDDTVRVMGLDAINLPSGTHIKSLSAALKVIYQGFMNDGMRHSFTVLYLKSIEWSKYYLIYLECLKDCDTYKLKTKLQTAPILAAALSTLRFSTQKLPDDLCPEHFWTGVATGDMIKAKSPMAKLRNLILESQLRSSKFQRGNISPSDLKAYATVAWNGYVSRREFSFLRLPKKHSSIPIHCTPFDFSLSIAQYRECFENSIWDNFDIEKST